jgi:ABC-type transport system substrate-binding protein
MLAEINVTLEINQVPSADRLTLYQEGEYDGMGFWEWGSDFPDANGMLLPAFHSRNLPPQSNQSFYKNPEVDALLDGADQESDPEVRSQMLIDAQKLIAADQPVIWLDHFKWFLAVDKAFRRLHDPTALLLGCLASGFGAGGVAKHTEWRPYPATHVILSEGEGISPRGPAAAATLVCRRRVRSEILRPKVRDAASGRGAPVTSDPSVHRITYRS